MITNITHITGPRFAVARPATRPARTFHLPRVGAQTQASAPRLTLHWSRDPVSGALVARWIDGERQCSPDRLLPPLQRWMQRLPRPVRLAA